MSKYGNKRVTVDGIRFDSIREANRWQELRLMERAGVVRDLQRQVPFELIPAQRVGGRQLKPIRYIADFSYLDERGNRVIEDAKGVQTPVYRIKKRMLLWLYGIEVLET